MSELQKAPFDIVVVGGGITGAGIARDAALRGLRVALFEKSDFATGTSSKSSKLIHGGLRYLEHGEIGLVFESVSERRVQSRMAPHLVKPMPFLVPIYETTKPGLELMNIGLWIYDTLAMFRAHKMHKTYRGDKARNLEPSLRTEEMRGAIEYYDCVTDDARLVLENIVAAQDAGAECHSYTEVVSIDRNQSGQVEQVRVRDVFSGDERIINAHSVVVAAGPWSDNALSSFGIQIGNRQRLLRPTKGVHVVFPREKLPLDHAITLLSPIDGRVMFAIPWRGRTVIGTTDTDYEGRPEDCHADYSDVSYLCDSANQYFPDADFSPDDVIATWAGLRPLIFADEGSASEVSREHEVFVLDDGVVVIAGGKLTTYRLMAKEAVKATIRWLRTTRPTVLVGRRVQKPRTKKRPLPGAEGLPSQNQQGVAALAATMAEERGLDPDLCQHLASIYGVRAALIADILDTDGSLAEPMEAGLPHVWAEVVHAVRNDLACTVDDVLSRRIPLILISMEQGLEQAERVADILADELSWNDDQRQASLDHFRREVQDSRGFRDGPDRSDTTEAVLP